MSVIYCYECGEELIADPDGSPGVYVHQERELDNDHSPIPDVEEEFRV